MRQSPSKWDQNGPQLYWGGCVLPSVRQTVCAIVIQLPSKNHQAGKEGCLSIQDKALHPDLVGDGGVCRA